MNRPDLRPNASDTNERFRDAFSVVEQFVVLKYKVRVLTTDVPGAFTGDIDGESILIDRSLNAEEALFVLVHLFGHTVQWNVSPRDRELGLLRLQPALRPTEDLLVALADYERVAARYSQQLLIDCGVHGLDKWLAEYSSWTWSICSTTIALRRSERSANSGRQVCRR